MKKIYLVNSDFINSRLDRWFRRVVCQVPQSLIEKSIRSGNIKVNNKKEKSSYKLKNQDQIIVRNINFSPNKQKIVSKKYIPTKKDLSFSSNIFVEDNENFAVINKPPGIAVQSGTKSIKNIMDILRSTQEFNNSLPLILLGA